MAPLLVLLSTTEVVSIAGPISNAVQAAPRMDAFLAEQLVQKWQAAKAQALGQDHAIEKLSEVSFVYAIDIFENHGS